MNIHQIKRRWLRLVVLVLVAFLAVVLTPLFAIYDYAVVIVRAIRAEWQEHAETVRDAYNDFREAWRQP